VPRIRRALISVSDKRGLITLASALHARGVEIISTGGTLAFLQKNAIPARQVSEITGFPEILDGRVKTLHPVIHAGLLAVLDNPEHVRQLDEHKITPIDMVVVNL
jgi:phosphoribosylaminoimidazolecarboxamide formyltransferase / IMP cyclohydrolase